MVATVVREINPATLAPASERQDHTTSPSALGHVRLTCPQRPPHPHLTYRDDRPKRPSSSRRDAREHRCDLPDGASADACDRLARRAICAWRACGNCPSGKCVHGCKPRPSQSARIDSEIGASPSSLQTTPHFQCDQRPPLWHLGDTPRLLKMSVDWGRPEAAGRRPK